MTTYLKESSNPRLPAPSAYAHFLDRLAAQKAEADRRRRKELAKAFAIGLAFVAVLLTAFTVAYWEMLK